MGNWSSARQDFCAWYCSATSTPPDCRASAYTLRQDRVSGWASVAPWSARHSQARLVMSSMSTSISRIYTKSQWRPARIEDSRLEFILVHPVGLASVPLGTAPQCASEAWFSFTFWISKSQRYCRCWYCAFRYIWLCFLRCATGMRCDLPHWCEIIKIGVPVGWCEVCPLMWESARARTFKTLLIMGKTTNLNWCRASAINSMSLKGKPRWFFLVPA